MPKMFIFETDKKGKIERVGSKRDGMWIVVR